MIPMGSCLRGQVLLAGGKGFEAARNLLDSGFAVRLFRVSKLCLPFDNRSHADIPLDARRHECKNSEKLELTFGLLTPCT